MYTGRSLENPVTGQRQNYEIKIGILWSWKRFLYFKGKERSCARVSVVKCQNSSYLWLAEAFEVFSIWYLQNIWTSTIFLLYGLDLPKWETDSCILSKNTKSSANEGNTCLPRCISFAFGTLTLSVSFTSGFYDIHQIQQIRRKKEATLV